MNKNMFAANFAWSRNRVSVASYGVFLTAQRFVDGGRSAVPLGRPY